MGFCNERGSNYRQLPGKNHGGVGNGPILDALAEGKQDAAAMSELLARGKLRGKIPLLQKPCKDISTAHHGLMVSAYV